MGEGRAPNAFSGSGQPRKNRKGLVVLPPEEVPRLLQRHGISVAVEAAGALFLYVVLHKCLGYPAKGVDISTAGTSQGNCRDCW